GSTPGDYVVTAFADANILDPNPANNLAGALTTVLGTADLSVSLTAPASVPLGATVRFRAVVTNTGPDLANQILLTLALPDHLAATLVTDVSLNPFSCNLPASSPPVVTCKLNPLVVGSINADIVDVVAEALAPLTVTATIGSHSADPDLSHNTDTATVTVTR